MPRPAALAARRYNCFAAASVIAEDRLAMIASIHHLADRAGILNPQLPEHGQILSHGRVKPVLPFYGCKFREPFSGAFLKSFFQ